MTPRRLPGNLLLTRRVFSPCSQHGPLYHREEIGGADDATALQWADDSTGAREKIEADLRPEDGPIQGLAAQEDTGHQGGHQQEWHDEPQELVTRQLKGKSAVAKGIQ